MPRPRLRYLTLGAVCSALVVWACELPAPRELPGSHEKALATWKEHEKTVKSAIDQMTWGNEFGDACVFFARVTGIEIDADGDWVGWHPGPHARADLEHVRAWHAAHRGGLVWDEAAKTVSRRVQSEGPLGSPSLNVPEDPRVLELWERHESAVDKPTRPPDAKLDLHTAAAFFSALARLPLRFDEATGYPTTETREDFGRLQAWFGEHKDRLYWDDEAQAVKQRPATTGG